MHSTLHLKLRALPREAYTRERERRQRRRHHCDVLPPTSALGSSYVHSVANSTADLSARAVKFADWAITAAPLLPTSVRSKFDALVQSHPFLAYVQRRRGADASQEAADAPPFSSEWGRKAWENASKAFADDDSPIAQAASENPGAVQQPSDAVSSSPDIPKSVQELSDYATTQLSDALQDASAEMSDLTDTTSTQLSSAAQEASAELSELADKASTQLSSVVQDATAGLSELSDKASAQLSSLSGVRDDIAAVADEAANQVSEQLSEAAALPEKLSQQVELPDLSSEGALLTDKLSEQLSQLPDIREEAAVISERVSEQISRTSDDVGGTVAALSDALSEQLSRLPDVREESAALSERVSGQISRVSDDVSGTVAALSDRVSDQFKRLPNIPAQVDNFREQVGERLSRLPDVPSEIARARERAAAQFSQLLPAPEQTAPQTGPVRQLSDAVSSGKDALEESGKQLERLLQGGANVFTRGSDGPQQHFGTDAVQSAAQDLVSAVGVETGPLRQPQLPFRFQLPPLPEGLTSLPRQLRDTVSGLPRPDEALQALINNLTSLTPNLGDTPARGPQVPTFNPDGLQPHFGTRAVVEALQPLTSHLTLRGSPVDSDTTALNISTLTSAALQGGQGILEDIIHSAGDTALRIDGAFRASGAQAEGSRVMSSAAEAIRSFEAYGYGGYSAGFLTALALVITAAVVASVPPRSYDPLAKWVTWEEVPTVYNQAVLAQYYASRPVMVAKRTLRLLWALARFGSLLAFDSVRGQLYSNSAVRARQLREIIERLGPAYVKVAQALSTRVDILDAQYLLQIELLQDRVPPFPTDDALKVMADAWGRPVEQVLSKISDEPIAAASLGQVYRGRLRGLGGGEVAIKVLRPGVLASVSLDLYLMRAVALLLQRLPSSQVRTDWASLIEEWGKRFFAEMDYSAEAASADLFAQQMADLPGIKVPAVYHELTTSRVLTAEWVEGEKLSESLAGDVRQLCNTLLNCYLTQLLETGTLHADPHPGNLIRTPDGKICILDYGLMTDVTPQQSMALVEYISHLSIQDWASVPDDLRKLGFISADAPDSSVIVEPLGRILTQLSVGGGAKGVNIDQIVRDIETLSEDYPFEVPSYFALILRCFSVIEGIALRVDPSYSIIQECFPYLARRLLSDKDPRLQAALKATLYGDQQRIDIARLQRLASGFSRFTVDGISTAPQTQAAATPVTSPESAPLLNATSREALRLVFAAEGSYAAELLAEEAAAAVDALGRATAFEVCRLVLGSLPAMAALQLRGTLPQPLQPLVPIPAPINFLARLQPLVAPSAEDQQALETAKAIPALLQGAAAAAASGGAVADPVTSTVPQPSQRRVVQLIRELAEILPELAPGLLYTGNLFLQRLGSRIAARVVQRGLGENSSERRPAASPASTTAAPVRRPLMTTAASGGWGPPQPLVAVPMSRMNGDVDLAQQMSPQQQAAAAFLPGAIMDLLWNALPMDGEKSKSHSH